MQPASGGAALTQRPPALDRLLERPALQVMLAHHGREAVTAVAREGLAAWRLDPQQAFDVSAFEQACDAALTARAAPRLKPVFNLTGTVLHTNLGRAPMPPEAIEAVAALMRHPGNLEYDLAGGARGDRDDHLDALLRELTGAEAVTVVNNNAAAVMLVLAALAGSGTRREVPVSRGELVEIGGAFRIPDIMRRAGAKLVEVGTTNRTHLADFDEAIGPKTALVMKVHTSNYAIAGFTSAVPEAELAALCRRKGVPFVVDLGSGSLVDLAAYGLPNEPLPGRTLADGAHLVTFSGDKLLGGPQAGLIVGEKTLVQRIKKHPLKRALRVGKMTVAALEAVLQLYRHPETLRERLPVLRLLTRPVADIRATAERMAPALQAALWSPAMVDKLGARVDVSIQACRSQIGSGSLPVDRLESACLSISAAAGTPSKLARGLPDRLAEHMRQWPMPVIGRIEDQRLKLDLRCLEAGDEAAWLAQLPP